MYQLGGLIWLRGWEIVDRVVLKCLELERVEIGRGGTGWIEWREWGVETEGDGRDRGVVDCLVGETERDEREWWVWGRWWWWEWEWEVDWDWGWGGGFWEWEREGEGEAELGVVDMMEREKKGDRSVNDKRERDWEKERVSVKDR
jgi:hypothetical protein